MSFDFMIILIPKYKGISVKSAVEVQCTLCPNLIEPAQFNSLTISEPDFFIHISTSLSIFISAF